MKNPRRRLTKLAEPRRDFLMDNTENDLIVHVDDILKDTEIKKKMVSHYIEEYKVIDLLGKGTFGQVFKCSTNNGENVAVKIIKNHPAYHKQAIVEVQITKMFKEQTTIFNDVKHIVQMRDFFTCKGHLCIVFELLGIDLYQMLENNQLKGHPLPIVQGFLSQMLQGLCVLSDSDIIHCDIKPENIVLVGKERTMEILQENQKHQIPLIKLIDFGSACFENHTVYSYIQSRFYRSPEVLLGLPYDGAIDMWSLACTGYVKTLYNRILYLTRQ